jgi:hypothetical protein
VSSAVDVLGSSGAALDILEVGAEGAVTVGIHDATRFQWTVTVPLPARGKLAYSIQVDLEVPTNAAARQAPWEQIQTFTRLDEAPGPVPEAGATIDALRRAAVSLRRMLARAGAGFARHAAMRAAQEAEDTEGDRYGFLVVWLETALLAVAETRDRLARTRPGDTPQVASERALIDELASVSLLETLADASRAVRDLPPACPPSPEIDAAVARVHARIDEAVAEEMAHRRASGFLTMSEPSAAALDAYVTRAARLRKHFDEVLYLDRESYQLDERVQQLMTSFAALFAGCAAFLLQIVLVEKRGSPATGLGLRLATIALLAGACYMARDRLKELARSWLTGKVYRFHAQRVSRYRIPERRMATRDVLVRTREWCDQTTQALPDVLNPEAGATLPRTRIRYLQRGVIAHLHGLPGEGSSRVRHIFRYDVSPLLPRLADEITRVPFVDGAGAVHFADAPRRYLIPVSIRLQRGGESVAEHATVVLEKRGITRVDPALGEDAFREEAEDRRG